MDRDGIGQISSSQRSQRKEITMNTNEYKKNEFLMDLEKDLFF